MEALYQLVFMFTDINFKQHSFHIEATKTEMLKLVDEINSYNPKAVHVYRFNGESQPILVYNKGLVPVVTW